MIVNGDGQSLLRLILPDAIQVELALDLRRLRHGELRLLLLCGHRQLAVEDVFAKDDAVVADVNARPGDELADFRVRLAAEAAHREVGRSGHANYTITDVFSTPGISR